MDQERAQLLFKEGGTFVFLGVPKETEFGIDMQCWNTEQDFRGVKMIPPGLHYVHYSAVSQKTGDVTPRSGFMHYFHKREFLVRMWDKNSEDISKDEISDESIERLKGNMQNLDKFLAAYPYENWQKWKSLTYQITEELVEKLSPQNGIIRSCTELLSCSDKDRPRGIKSPNKVEIMEDASTNDQNDTPSTSTPSHTSPNSKRRKSRLSTAEEKEDALLPELKPAPGTSLRFTEIPKDKCPEGASPQEITKNYLDQSYTLELVLSAHDQPLHLVGELQFAYLCFLIGHSLDAFEHWKSLVVLLCSCEDAITKHRAVYYHFIQTLQVQIEEIPEEFLADIVMNKNLVYKKLRELFKTVHTVDVEPKLLSLIERFKENLTQKLSWDFTGLDSDDEDERPVVVSLD